MAMKGFVAAAATAAVLAPVCFWASSAAASETVVGDETAHACFEASRSTRADAGAVHVCDVALEGLLQPADEGAALVNRGVIRLRRGEYAAAHSDFDAAIPLIPQSGEARFNRGAVFIAEHRYKEAAADLDKAIELGVREPAKAYYYRGIAHDYLDDETAAYQDYKQAEALAPNWDLPKHELQRFTVTRK
jgi:tetratricopeptide (TPR) repeat protein